MTVASTESSGCYKPLAVDDVDQGSESPESRPDLSCQESLSLSHRELAIEVHSKVSLLQAYSAPLEWHAFDWRWLFGWDEFLTIEHQWPQMLLSFLMVLLAIWIDCLAQVYLQLHPYPIAHVDCKVPPPLFDIGFYFLGEWKSAHAVNWTLCIFFGLTVVRFVVITGPFSMRWTVARRWLLCTGILFLLRGFSIICTILPNPDPYCVSNVERGNIFLLALEVVVGIKVTCRDVLYSGHTVHFTLCALIWRDYSPLCPLWTTNFCRRWKFSHIFGYITAVFGYIVIIGTHFHYTVDVWIAFWMTYFVWSYYHEVIKASIFHTSWLMRFITWLERHATDLRYWRIRVGNQLAYDKRLWRDSRRINFLRIQK